MVCVHEVPKHVGVFVCAVWSTGAWVGGWGGGFTFYLLFICLFK